MIPNYIPAGFDEIMGVLPYQSINILLTNEELLIGDWTKGPAGTGEVSFETNAVPPLDAWAGSLCTSWELTDPTTLTFNIRKGVYFQDKPPVNGREMDANDVVFSIKRQLEKPGSYILKSLSENQLPLSVDAPDKWTVVIKSPEGQAGALLESMGDGCSVVPHEIDEYGDMNKWQNVVGTGPFILKDHIQGSVSTLERNPNYWDKDPFRPDNQLPYLDKIKILAIKDRATQLSALRTSKADFCWPVYWEDGQLLVNSLPDLQYSRGVDYSGDMIWMRLDKPELPFKDKRVRHALMLGINNQEILDDYFEGNAEMLTYPVLPLPDFADVFVPLDELPESSRELYEYHPDKAKQLLAEAGYPNGFETEMVIYEDYADFASLIKGYWDKIGVNVKLDVREKGVWQTTASKRWHEQMLIRSYNTAKQFLMLDIRPGNNRNLSYVDDPYLSEKADEVAALFFEPEKQAAVYKELVPYMIDQCYVIQFPTYYQYFIWQPWVKDYYGMWSIGRNNMYRWIKWLWIDQDLKKSITGG
ncbi:ABC transporter substrate-binding protein [Chloroflexota bacterium]